MRCSAPAYWAARLYTGLCGLLTVLITAALARRLWGNAAGWRAGFMSGSSLLLVLMGHQLTLDMSLTFYTTLTLAAFCIAQDSRTSPAARRYWMWLVWAAAAGAFLTKGLIALVLPGIALFAYSLLQRDWTIWRRLSLASGLPLFLLLALPWMVLMQRALPQFFDFFVVREHFQRYLTLISDRYEPWWFFIAILAGGSMPWLIPTVRALLGGWRASAAPGAVRCATAPVDLERGHLPVLLRLGLEARALHPADVSLRGAADGLARRDAAAPRPALHGHDADRDRRAVPGC